MRLFEENRVTPKGIILPINEFRLFFDVEHPVFDGQKASCIIKRAESYLDAEIKTAPLWNYRQYQEQGSVQLYSRFYMDRLDKLFYLGIAEGLEGKGRFTDKLCDYVWAILEMASWVLPEHTIHLPGYGVTKVPPVVGDKYMHGLELGSVYMAATLATVYHYARDAMDSVSPIIGQRILYELRNRIITPYLCCEFTWGGSFGNKVNNWNPWNISGILLITALTVDSTEEREEIVRRAMRHLDNFVSFYKEDGGCDEGPTYWGAAGGSLFDCLELLYDMSGGRIDLYHTPIVKAIGEYIPKFNISGTRFVNFADSHSTARHDGTLLRRYGEKCGSRILTALGDEMESLSTPAIHFHHPYRSMRSLLTPQRQPSDVVRRAARSVYFPDLKVMIERESEDPDRGLLLAIKGGNNNESHNHNDIGGFIVYSDGKPVLIDAGVGEYTKQTFSPRRYELWFMQSNYHNLPAFDGIGQKNGAEFRSRNEVYDPSARSFSAEISGAYPEEAGVVSYTRRAALAEGEITVTDSLTLDGERLIDFVFMCHREPLITRAGAVSLPEGRSLIYDPTALTARIEAFDPVGMNTTAAWGTDKLWRIHLETSAKGGTYTFKIK